MTDPISKVFMILAVVLAVLAGLWFGAVLGESASGKQKDGTQGKRRSFGQALSSATTTAVLRLWKWQRQRKRAEARRDDEG
jgi:hypothetical protein